MLVLSRRPGEQIMIGDEIVIVLVEARLGVARIGIDAPRSVPIVRTELCHDRATQRERTVAGRDRQGGDRRTNESDAEAH
jgi:carbon storage regulator